MVRSRLMSMPRCQMAAARGSSTALSQRPSLRPMPVPGISSGIDEGRSAGEPLAELAGVWELSWSEVVGARRRQ